MNMIPKVVRTTGIGENGLGWVRFRTQSGDEEAWRRAMTPGEGQRLVLNNLSPIDFEIRVEPCGPASPDPGRPDDLDAAPQPELLEIAAKSGVKVPDPNIRKADLIGAIRKARRA